MKLHSFLLFTFCFSLLIACENKESTSSFHSQIDDIHQSESYLSQFESEDALNTWVQAHADSPDSLGGPWGGADAGIESYEETAAPTSVWVHF